MGHSLQPHVDAISAALGSHPEQGRGTQTEAARAAVTLLNRDAERLDTRIATLAEEAELYKSALAQARRDVAQVRNAADHETARLQASLDEWKAENAKIRGAHLERLGEIGEIINVYHRTLDQLAQQLLAKR